MSKILPLLLFFIPFLFLAQEEEKSGTIISPEILLGYTTASNENFPETSLQKQIAISLSRIQNKKQEWAYRLNYPRTGISLHLTDFGNTDHLGYAITVMPVIEFPVFKSKKMKALVGMGGSYFTEKFDEVDNPLNQAVSTDVTMSFKAFLNYRVYASENIDWKVGIGYFHHSNGHTRLPNNGYNSFLASVSADIYNKQKRPEINIENAENIFTPSVYSYLSVRGGYGQNVLALSFNDKKDVYIFSAEYGKVLNKTYKLGAGFYYKFYQHYYDYIKGNESLVQDGNEFDFFKEQPYKYATNYGVHISGEILLNHFGIEAELGFNIFKPAYSIDWRINQGWDNTPREIPEYWVLGEYNSKFEFKRAVASRLGLKYYFIGTDKVPKHNFFISTHISANLGQADYAEFGFGYVTSFGFKERKKERAIICILTPSNSNQ